MVSKGGLFEGAGEPPEHEDGQSDNAKLFADINPFFALEAFLEISNCFDLGSSSGLNEAMDM